MGRDPIDTSLAVLIDEALSVSVQLREHGAARAAIARLGIDPDALADEVRAAFDAAVEVRARRDSLARRQALANADAAAVVVSASAWAVASRRSLTLLPDATPGAVAAVRAAIPVRVRAFKTLPASLREAMHALARWRGELGAHPLVERIVGGGASLLREAERVEGLVVQVGEGRARVATHIRAARLALKEVLRLARRVWRAAKGVDPHLGDLDLRLAAAAVAPRGVSAATPDLAHDRPAEAPSAGDQAPPDASPVGDLVPGPDEPHAVAPDLIVRRVEQVEVFAPPRCDDA